MKPRISRLEIPPFTKGRTMNDRDRTRPSETTRHAEEADALVHAHPDDPPTKDEEDAAERGGEPDAKVAESYKEALERGADQKGEGRIA
jgi:hypothetical protein